MIPMIEIRDTNKPFKPATTKPATLNLMGKQNRPKEEKQHRITFVFSP